MRAALIYPHQLFSEHPALSGADVCVLVEEPLLMKQYRFHRQKLILHRASMQHFADRLRRLQVVVPGQSAMLECVEWPSGFGLERLAEHLGVRFSLEGDAGPDRQTARALRELAEVGRPPFDHRGIQSFPADGSRVEPNRGRHSGGAVTAAESPGTRCSEAGHCAVPLCWPPLKKVVWGPPGSAGSTVQSFGKQSTCACTTNKLAA